MTRAADGRLDSRPSVRDGEPPPPGVHPLPGGHDGLLVVPPGAPGPRPLLVFFHGAGGRAQHSLPLVETAAGAARVLVVLPTSRGGTWDLISGGLGPDVAALDAALGEVFRRLAVSGVAFAGFSDGASYALSLGLANGDLVSAVLAFSPGFAAPPSQHGRPRIWVAHGTADAVLPVDACGRRVVRLLSGAGYDVHYEEFPGPHVVRPSDVRAALGSWLASDDDGGS